MKTFGQIFEEYRTLFLSQNPRVSDDKFKPLYGIIINSEVKTSNLPYILDQGEEAFVYCCYSYRVLTNDDQDGFFLYMNKNGEVEDYITKDGWNFRFNKPTTGYKHSSPSLIISKDNLEMKINVRPSEIKMSYLWKLFCEATKCSTQLELDYLKEVYTRDSTIERLTKDNAKLIYKESLLEERIESYKGLLKKIEDLVDSANQKTNN